MRSVALVMAIAGLVGSQQIVPTSVPIALRDSWCSDQTSSCPLICAQVTNSGTVLSNTCNPTTLAWTCVCKNGLTPNVTEYSLTIPFHECQEYGNQCVANCGQNNNACANNCRVDNPCGALDPTKVNATSSTSSSATATGSSTSTASNFASFGGSGNNNGGSSKSAASSSLVQVGQLYGFSVVAAGIFAGFCLIL